MRRKPANVSIIHGFEKERIHRSYPDRNEVGGNRRPTEVMPSRQAHAGTPSFNRAQRKAVHKSSGVPGIAYLMLDEVSWESSRLTRAQKFARAARELKKDRRSWFLDLRGRAGGPAPLLACPVGFLPISVSRLPAGPGCDIRAEATKIDAENKGDCVGHTW